MMKKIFLITTCALFFFGCNMNPNKEARIQKLETEIQQTMNRINKLESRLQTLEDTNEKLKTRVLQFEKE